MTPFIRLDTSNWFCLDPNVVIIWLSNSLPVWMRLRPWWTRTGWPSSIWYASLQHSLILQCAPWLGEQGSLCSVSCWWFCSGVQDGDVFDDDRPHCEIKRFFFISLLCCGHLPHYIYHAFSRNNQTMQLKVRTFVLSSVWGIFYA